LKAIALDDGRRALFEKAGSAVDAGVTAASDLAGFIAAAKTRQWDRERMVRTLA
jgi:catalase